MFMPSEFTPTQWSTTAEKADFGNKLLRFIEAGWKRSMFTKKLYNQLSNTYGHIAHFNLTGFYEEWFTNDADRLRFLEHLLESPCYGQPEFTFCDVERALQREIRLLNLVGRYRLLVEEADRSRELRLLAKLEQKYRPQSAESVIRGNPATDSAVSAPASVAVDRAPQQFTLF